LRIKRHAEAVMPQDLHQRAAAATEDVQVAGVRIAVQRLLHLTRQPLHPAPHVGMAGCDPYPNAGRQHDHRATTTLMIPHPRSPGVVTGMRTRMSVPSATSTAAASASVLSHGGGATTTSVKPATASQSSRRQR